MLASSKPARICAALALIALAACSSTPERKDDPPAGSAVFYTVTGEIALSRHQAREAALQYATVAAHARDVKLLRRATEVTSECLQPSLTAGVAARWLGAEPGAVDAHRAAARAALELHRIEQSAAEYRAVLDSSPRGASVEFAALETELGAADNIYGARQVADLLAAEFPASMPALRMQAFTALRADDPASAARFFQAALAAPAPAAGAALPDPPPAPASGLPPAAAAAPTTGADEDPSDAARSPEPAAPNPETNRRELVQGLRRARILAGDVDPPLAEARADLETNQTAENRLDYALLLLAAQQNDEARTQLTLLSKETKARAIALRLLGLVDFQEEKLADAGSHFAELTTLGQYTDDAYYYLGLIAERHSDVERALRLYLQVQMGDNALPALLHAASLLRAHGAAPAAEELLDQLVDDDADRAPEILVARARIYSDSRDFEHAVSVLERAQEQYPDNVQIRYALASTAEEEGKVAVALRMLQRVAQQRPTDPAALNAYGYTLADHNRELSEARKLIERAYAAAPRNAAILDSMGWIRYRLGRPTEALGYLRDAYADDHDGEIAAHLGEVYWSLGRHDDAERVWSEASRADPDNPLLKSTRQRLHAS